jgi:AraC-like DNA-binding protein
MMKKKRPPRMGKPPKLVVIGMNVNGRVRRKKLSQFQPTEREYYRDLHYIIDQVFATAAEEYDWTWAQLASHANLSSSTVASLGERMTRWPRFMTIYKLAKAIGWELVLKEGKIKRTAMRVAAG